MRPVAGTPVSDSFHASSRASDVMAAFGGRLRLKSPIIDTPVDGTLKPPACAPTTGWSMPPARPSKTCP